ncbi:MAG: ABC transporter ATP-binding protein/permease [Eubacterium sp.]|nr:ABC transporter ATP-binding protein/permease [Eubacterium sp.]
MAYNSFKEDEQSVEKSKRETLIRLFSYLFKYKGKILIVLALMGYCVAVSLVNPLIIETAIDTFIAKKDFQGLLVLLLVALVINVLMVVAIKVRMLIMAKICNKILLTIRQELYSHIQTLDFHFFDSRPSGKILSRIMGDINSLKDVLSNCVTTLIPDFITVISVVAIMFIKNWKLAIAALLTTPIMAVFMVLIEIKGHPRWQAFRKKSSNLNAFIHEDMAGMGVVKGFTAEDETTETFDELTKEHITAFKEAIRVSDWFGSVIDISWGLGCIFLYYAGIVILGVEHVSVGILVAFGTYTNMFWHPIYNLSNFYNQIITNIAGAERIFEILDTEPEISDSANVEEMKPIEGKVCFNQVTFRYEDGERPVLENLSFEIKPGETIALVGATGAGKTTIVNLISRFYDVQEGTVTIDDVDVKSVSIESLRRQMGIMTQDNFLFTGTIRDNIKYGRLDATDEEVETAAKAVMAHDFISKLPDGYDTKLSERGGSLSVGQKQLIAFARTMISLPKILILDEATSSIDTKTEKLVQEGIERLLEGRTSFVIAHRLSTIKKADRIFVVGNGGIMEQGSPEALMKQQGAYYDLYMASLE